jgi:hypothetical protein
MLNSLRTKTIFIGIIMLVGCHKDTQQASNCSTCQDEECHDYEWPGSISFETYIKTGPQYTHPFFNPNNGDEFIYVKGIPGSPTNQLIKHVISSGIETILCSSEFIINQPQWGKSGWIVFIKGIGQNALAKIRDDGTGFMQISPSGIEVLFPMFDSSGNQIIVESEYTSYDYSAILDLNGNLIDSLRIVYGNTKIGFPKALNGSFKNSYYNYYNNSTSKYGYCKLIDGTEINNLFLLDMANGLPIDMCKNNFELFYVQGKKGLFGFNLTSQNSRVLIPNCLSRYIRAISMSPDGQHIIYEQVKGVQIDIDNQIIDEQSEIYTINVYTKEKIKIVGE